MSSENTLRTLKDIDFGKHVFKAENVKGIYYDPVAMRETIKAEAIKWYEERMRTRGEITFEDWEEFFNMTKEDLK